MRRSTRLVVLLTVGALLAGACSRDGGGSGSADDARPNIILLLTDDQTLEQMRVLDRTRARLAGSGLSFTQAVVSYPTCCPSRATILTGQYAQQHGVLWNAPPTGGFQAFDDHETAMPAALEGAGYHTSHIGRFLNGYGFFERDRFQPEGWSDWHALIAPSDGQYFGFSMLENGEIVTYGDTDYLTDVIRDLALETIDREAESGVPFFMQVAFTAPHASYGSSLAEFTVEGLEAEIAEGSVLPPVPAPRHEGSLSSLEPPRPESFDEADLTDKPGFIEKHPPLDELAIASYYRAEVESLLAVDEAVDAILDRLEQVGLDDETYVVFTSDNGFFHGEHGIAFGKYLPYEEALRVPLIVRGPGIPSDEERDVLVSNIDLAPTILGWAGAESLRPVDGLDLAPFMEDPALTSERPLLIEGHAPPGPRRSPYLGVRTPEWSYLEWETGDVELYDLESDPLQLENLVDDPAAESHRAALAATLEKLRECRGPGCTEIRIAD